MGATRNTTANPIIPAHRISDHKVYVAINVINGDVQIKCTSNVTNSNRFTSFDNKFTSFPGVVSLKARCDNFRDWKWVEIV